MSREKQEKGSGFFEKVFYNLLDEDMSAGSGGVFGTSTTGGFGGGDTYAPGDARVPHILGQKKRKKNKSKHKKRKNKKMKKKMEEDFVIPKTGADTSLVQKRPPVGRM